MRRLPTLTLVVLAVALRAQNFAEITGGVTDPSGAVMTGAVVTVTNTATNQTRRSVTNETGTYSLPYLVPGVYDLRVGNRVRMVDGRVYRY